MLTPIYKTILKGETNSNPVWFMRQAGRYLPEFRDIRFKNPNFIKLCLNSQLSSELTLQPIKDLFLSKLILVVSIAL